MACPYFRYFDLRMAEGITQSGQLGIRWVAKDINKFLNKASNNKNKNFIHVKTVELIQREWEIEERKVRPITTQTVHTGFLSFVRKVGN